MKAAEGAHVEAMYHLATFPDFIGEPFRSPLSEEETWQWLLRAAEGGCVQRSATLARRSRPAIGVKARFLKTSQPLLDGIGVRQ